MAVIVGCIVGSTSSTSINRKLVAGLIEIERSRRDGDGSALEFRDIPIGDLPLYDRELDERPPAAVTVFKDAIRRSDALIVATPEYNRSIPGPLKNALDWGSRPSDDDVFAGRPVGIIGASTGATGTAVAQQHLRTILAHLDAPTLNQPEVFIQFTPERFADDGTVVDASTRRFLGDWLVAYRSWIDRFVPARTG